MDFLARLAMVLLLSFSLVQNAFADIFNDATASGTYQLVPVVSGNSFVSIPVVLNAPTIELLKSSTFNDESGDGFAQLGETISYAFSVQNTGNVTLTNITLTDPTVTVSGGPIASLAPAAIDTTTFTATYTLVAADLLALQVTNSATVTATPPSGPNVTDVSDSQNPGDDTGADDDVTNTNFMVPIDAVDDDFTASPVNGLAGGNTPTVFTNDTLNGAAFASALVTPTIISNGGIAGLTINASGTLTIPAGTAAATYTVNYEICEVATPTNCDTADVTVVVSAAAIVAVDDDFSASPVNGLAGGNTATVFTNDTLNGAPFVAADVTPSITATGGLTGVAINASGTLTVPAGTPAATYTVTYQICELLNPTNCDTANVTVVVTAATIVATDDDFSASPVNGLAGGNTPTVFTNDTLNGAPFAPTDVTPSITVTGGLTGVTINASGTVTVPAGTVAATYTVTYQICEVLNAANCDTANVTVVVTAATIVATDDDFSASPVNGLAGGNTATVFTNDTLNGAAFAPAAVTPSITVTGGLTGVTINASGTLTIPAGTPAATYTVTYQICEVLNATNCDTANVTIVVAAAAIVANDDDFSATPVNGLAGGTTATVFTNDTLDAAAFAPAAVTPSITATGGLTGVTINASGTLAIPAGTPAATYAVTYQICEALNPTNCDTANVTVVVTAAAIVANDDDFSASPVNGLAGGTTATVFTNDTLNGAAFAPAAVNASITVDGGLTGVTINASGTLTVPAATPAATYTVTYQICEALNPANCDTANVTVVVTAAAIVANDDDFSAAPINGATGGTTVTVFTNDTLNGAAFLTTDVTPSITADGGITGLTISPAGLLTIPSGTAPATYVATYQICEVLNVANCDTANATIVVFDDPVVTGTVFFDSNGDGNYGGGEPNAGPNYIVQLFNSLGALLGTATTNASGFYSISAPSGVGYRLLFTNPNTLVVGSIESLTLPPGTTVIDQNEPIDPSGIIYNSVTRLPVAGVTVTISSGGNPLPGVCLIAASQQGQVTAADGAYRFDIVAGADPACPVGETEYSISIANPAGYAAGVSSTMPPQIGAYEVTACAVSPASCLIAPSAAPPVSPNPGFYYLAFLLELNDGNVMHNHIAIDPLASTASGLTKRALVTQVRRGERVPYVITAADTTLALARIVDIIPPGFDYVANSATVNGVALEPVIAGRNLTFEGPIVAPDPGGDITIELTLIATVAVTTGPHVNTAQLIDPATDQVVGTARATVTVLAEHVFDCGDIIGKVFDDRNRNGSQDEGEPGLAGVRLVTVKGVLITTDKHGRFHVACADVPDADIGSNFILKLDTRTLPTGFKMTTANPRIVRLTAGKMSKLNYGAAITRLVRFDMTEEAFAPGSVKLKAQWLRAVDKLISVLETDKSTLRLTYTAKTKDKKLAAERIAGVEKLILSRWAEQGGGYELPIETRVMGAK